MAGLPPENPGTDASGRPTLRLPISHLLRISAYWLGLTAIDAGVNSVVSNRILFNGLVPESEVGRAMSFVGLGGAILGIVVQPTVGAISDYTVSRWGRRKPWIVIGSLLDVVFLLGIAYSQTLLAIAAFVLLLSFSTNLARGPFQGYVPDMVPGRQVGLASALVGLMQVLGNVVGFAIGALAATLTDAERKAAALEGREAADYLPLALIAIAIVELVTMVSVVLRVGQGQPPRPREGKSWVTIAREAWATDILQERSYVYLVTSRLFFLTGGSILVNFFLVYLAQVHSLDQGAANGVYFRLLVLVAITNVAVILPAARLSDRIGRKPVIYLACAVGAVGMAIAALAPTPDVAYFGGVLFAASAGTFLAVDWALLTDIIPKVAAGRYMGLSNVATGASAPISLLIGGLTIDFVNEAQDSVLNGARIAYIVGLALYLVAAILLRGVKEPARDARGEPAPIAA
jgi:MFS family permease